jgi:hypothetical protein
MPSVISDGYIAKSTVMLFRQTNAPIGWTKSSALNDYALRVVSGSVTTVASNTFSSRVGANYSFTWNAATLSTGQIGSHTHGIKYDDDSGASVYACHSGANSTTTGSYANVDTVNTFIRTGGTTSEPTGSGVPTAGSHTHTSTVATAVSYLDVIYCIKD